MNLFIYLFATILNKYVKQNDTIFSIILNQILIRKTYHVARESSQE